MTVLIKGGRIVTAADDYVADVFVDGERISLIGESLDVAADHVIDATGKYLLPGCIDPHTHLDMPFGGTTTIDDVESGHTAAAFGGTTCHVDFVIQSPGRELRRGAPVLARKARGQGRDRHGLPHGRHRPHRGRLARGARVAAGSGRHLVQAVHGVQGRADGRRRDAVQDDGGRGGDRRARDGARGERRRDRRAREEGARGRAHGAALARAHAAARDGGGGDEPRDPARPCRRLPALRRPRLLPRVGRADPAGARRGLERLGRDMHAVLLRRLHVPRAAELRGREVRLHAAAASEGEPGRALERGAYRRAVGDLDRPLRVHVGRAEGDRQGRLLEDPERRPGHREPAPDDPFLRCPRGADLAQPHGRAARDEPGDGCSGSTRARGRSRSAPTRTSSSSTRRRR